MLKEKRESRDFGNWVDGGLFSKTGNQGRAGFKRKMSLILICCFPLLSFGTRN
jgi:hypothetical protein